MLNFVCALGAQTRHALGLSCPGVACVAAAKTPEAVIDECFD